MILRNAKLGEEKIIINIINEAKNYQKSLGFEQWTANYPSIETIIDDINNNIGFVLCDNDEIVGYCALVIGVESVYNDIVGSWKSNFDYVTIHRIAISDRFRGKGLAKLFFDGIKSYAKENSIKSIRVDTYEKNMVMQNVLNREQFEYCGTVYYECHGYRMAYEYINNM